MFIFGDLSFILFWNHQNVKPNFIPHVSGLHGLKVEGGSLVAYKGFRKNAREERKSGTDQYMVTILNVGTDRFNETLQTQIRLLLWAVWSGSTLFVIPSESFEHLLVKPNWSIMRTFTVII